MADVKTLFRDTPREEYFYRMGFQEGYQAAKQNAGLGADATDQALAAAARNARFQVDE